MNVEIEGPDENGIVKVCIPPWEIFFIWPKKKRLPIPIAWGRSDKSRAYQEEDITPPKELMKRATELARIRFSAFRRRTPPKEDKSEQLRLPF